jgi:tetratricopeptide (TPR) repeat protein
MDSDACTKCADRIIGRLVQREIVLLIVLCAIAIPLFFSTKSVAARNRAMNIEIAGTFYRAGNQRLADGDVQGAIDYFRSATTNDHDNPEYMLALASALAKTDRIAEARQILERLRADAPESGEINLNLARLDSKQDRMADAVRYYHNALFGIWHEKELRSRRVSVRSELAEYLLKSGNNEQALSELLVLSSDIPDTEMNRVSLGRMFLKAGDPQHALQELGRALQLNAKSKDALSEAGRASFALADYDKAVRYFEEAASAGEDSVIVRDLLETSNLVLARDPLARGVGSRERASRLVGDLQTVSEEMAECVGQKSATGGAPELIEIQEEIDAGRQQRFRIQALVQDSDEILQGMLLIQRADAARRAVCPETTILDHALALIIKKHGVGERE